MYNNVSCLATELRKRVESFAVSLCGGTKQVDNNEIASKFNLNTLRKYRSIFRLFYVCEISSLSILLLLPNGAPWNKILGSLLLKKKFIMSGCGVAQRLARLTAPHGKSRVRILERHPGGLFAKRQRWGNRKAPPYKSAIPVWNKSDSQKNYKNEKSFRTESYFQ